MIDKARERLFAEVCRRHLFELPADVEQIDVAFAETGTELEATCYAYFGTTDEDVFAFSLESAEPLTPDEIRAAVWGRPV